ncbi:MAG TPA: hypothetical protein VGR16_07170 [Thermomicrobiales bacterium]|nr:hypothetical protein [Thermomicrobiales bacterium]
MGNHESKQSPVQELPAAVAPPLPLDQTAEPVTGPDHISPAIMIGIFVILLLCVALALIAYQRG